MKEQFYGDLETAEFQPVKNTVNIPAKITLNSNIQWKREKERSRAAYAETHCRIKQGHPFERRIV